MVPRSFFFLPLPVVAVALGFSSFFFFSYPIHTVISLQRGALHRAIHETCTNAHSGFFFFSRKVHTHTHTQRKQRERFCKTHLPTQTQTQIDTLTHTIRVLMSTGVSEEARRRNGIAVQRMFQRNAGQRAQTSAQLTREKTSATASDCYDGSEATGPTCRISATSAAALVGAVSGSGAASRPAWTLLDGRELLRHPDVDAPSHLSRQLALSAEMHTLTREEQQAVLARTTPVQQPTSALRLEELSGADRSCFVMAVQKARHARAVMAPDPTTSLTPCEAEREQWMAYHHQQAVLRYEQTLPRRRAVDPYVHLTGAQVDVSLTVPNTYTADVLAKRHGGRWVLDNAYRQQLYRGEPVMSCVMRGDFYAGSAAKRATRQPRCTVIAKNRRDVRVTSEINRAERRQRQQPENPCLCTK